MIETIRDGSMPPWQYKPTHSGARLSGQEKKDLIRGLEATFVTGVADGEKGQGRATLTLPPWAHTEARGRYKHRGAAEFSSPPALPGVRRLCRLPLTPCHHDEAINRTTIPTKPTMLVPTAIVPATSLVSAQIRPMIVPTTRTATTTANQYRIRRLVFSLLLPAS